MAKYQLQLLEIPESARSAVVEAGRTAGPPLNRRKFNAALMGSSTLPAIIAESDIRGPISGLRQHLADAGCKIEVVEAKIEQSAGERLSALQSKFQSLEPMEQKMVFGVGAVGIIALVMLTALVIGSEDPLPSSVVVAPSKMAKKTSTASLAKAKGTIQPIVAPKTPFMNFHDDLNPTDTKCSNDARPNHCLLEKIRMLSKTASLAVAADDSVDESSVEYLKVLHHRFFLCLAEQQSRPKEGDKDLVSAAFLNLRKPLIYRYGRESCDDDRSSMYSCVKNTRTMKCNNLTSQIEGAIVEYLNQSEVLPWTARFSDYYVDKVLTCLSSEQKRFIRPLERAKLHVFRYELAKAVGKVENTCQEEEYIGCARNIFNADCESASEIMYTDADKLVREITNACDILKECR